MSSLDARERDATLTELTSRVFDLVVIGGGITGAGILRDAALRGLDVALVEARDFASGTSSKSTKLIHGGIRYLAMGHIHVVREAARERKRVHQIAPHLAEPKWLTLPSRNRLEWAKYKIGVLLYERLGQVQAPDLHFDVKGESLREHEPLIDRDAFPYACVYREYLTDDARLVVGNIRGVAAPRLAVTGLIKDAGRVTGVRVRCEETGAELFVRAKGVINAAGPWVEDVYKFDGAPPPKSLVLSKGVHIVLPKSKVPLSEMILSVTTDNRPVFMIPRGDVVYVGTTDSRFEGPANVWPEVLPEEVSYLLEPVRRYLGISLTPKDCLTTWAGLRPLIAQRGKSTKEISRRDEIWTSESGLITIAGGKLTGYRKMAEDTIDVACRVSGLPAPGHVRDEPLPGGDFTGSIDDLARQVAQSYPMDETRAHRMASLYGSEATDVLALGAAPIADGADLARGEVLWAVQHEGASSLEDVLYRRTRTMYYSPEQLPKIVDPAAALMGESLGWSKSRVATESASLHERLARDLSPL
ncbi:MAG: glycerol-3-phosphate dehydrogenase/oxidase [Pseudomonadales bacterium]|nr:glycerol-3-phosphate dehydrogenase/oxidase [Pseudomonadales bacterium]